MVKSEKILKLIARILLYTIIILKTYIYIYIIIIKNILLQYIFLTS